MTRRSKLGQGIANSVGFAMAEEVQRARYGKKIVDHFTYVIAGDGCLMEGVSQEAIGLAGKHKLGKLIVLWDNNNITIDGTVDMADATDQVARFKASGWHVIEIDGHDPEAIDAAIAEAKAQTDAPTMIACKTHIALGHAAQDTSKGHGALTDGQQLLDAKAAYGWDHGPFDIPADVKSAWEAIGARGAAAPLAGAFCLAFASQASLRAGRRALARPSSALAQAARRQPSQSLEPSHKVPI